MSVVVAVRKGRRAAICSDSLTTQGSLRISGDVRVSPKKIHLIGRSYLGLTGNTAHHRVVASLVSNHSELLDLTSAQSMFESFRALQPILRDEYYVLPSEDDDQQEYESNQLSGLVCGPTGIFSLQSYREVTEFETYWAMGSGAEVALGALHATYESRRGALALAEIAATAACYHLGKAAVQDRVGETPFGARTDLCCAGTSPEGRAKLAPCRPWVEPQPSRR